MTGQQKKERQEFERKRNEDEKKHASQLQKMADQQRKEREEFEKAQRDAMIKCLSADEAPPKEKHVSKKKNVCIYHQVISEQ